MIAAPGQSTSYSPPLVHPFGFLLADGRRAGFCWSGKPRCVSVASAPHALKLRDPIITEGIGTCRSCGMRVYARKFAEGLMLIVEVNDAIVRRMAGEPMLPLESLSILRCVLPGVDVDLSHHAEAPDNPAHQEE